MWEYFKDIFPIVVITLCILGMQGIFITWMFMIHWSIGAFALLFIIAIDVYGLCTANEF